MLRRGRGDIDGLTTLSRHGDVMSAVIEAGLPPIIQLNIGVFCIASRPSHSVRLYLTQVQRSSRVALDRIAQSLGIDTDKMRVTPDHTTAEIARSFVDRKLRADLVSCHRCSESRRRSREFFGRRALGELGDLPCRFTRNTRNDGLLDHPREDRTFPTDRGGHKAGDRTEHFPGQCLRFVERPSHLLGFLLQVEPGWPISETMLFAPFRPVFSQSGAPR